MRTVLACVCVCVYMLPVQVDMSFEGHVGACVVPFFGFSEFLW